MSRKPSTETNAGADGIEMQIAELEHAVRAHDESSALALVTDSGRFWIETSQADRAAAALTRARDVFGRATAVGRWAHYLIAVDAALRLQDPRDDWFDRPVQEVSGDAVDVLLAAERMEFARLRRDLPFAALLLSELIPRLEANTASEERGDVYALATARFLAGNVLRHGGRYDLARSFIETASASLDLEVPAHAVEAMHCRYAMAVCDAIDGVPRVETLDVPRGQLVFASSLVVLSNAQASWFVGDVPRAIEFARRAEEGFSSIGYTRYALRARSVRECFSLWQALDSGASPEFGNSPIGKRLERALSPGSDVLRLNDLRPSAALSVLYVALAYAEKPDYPRSIHLPPVLSMAPSGDLLLRPTLEAGSLRSADRALREAMGVGKGRKVPLMPD